MIPLTHQFWRKLLVVAFTFLVFASLWGFSIAKEWAHRDILPYMGIILMITLVYIELLIIRDHLWVLEGSHPEALRWREAFFPKQTLRQLRLRKLVVVILSMIIFTWIYTRTRGPEIYMFLGVILMVTVLYFEVLTIRDELQSLNIGLKMDQMEKVAKGQATLPLNPQAEPDDLDQKEE